MGTADDYPTLIGTKAQTGAGEVVVVDVGHVGDGDETRRR